MSKIEPEDSFLDTLSPQLPDETLGKRDRLIAIFELVLKRTPDEETIQYHLNLLKTYSMGDICLGLVESEEARRQRQPVTSSIPGSLVIVMVTRHLDESVTKILDLLQNSLSPTDHITVINRSHSSKKFSIGSQVSIISRPGATVFECRAELALLGSDHEWLALIEDHNVPVDEWMDAAKMAITAAGETINYISGAVDNRQSIDFWSWCSYLTTFGRHRPRIMHATVALPGIANVLIRCSALPLGPYRPGQFEIEILPSLAKSGMAAPQMIVDHVQSVDLDHALKMHANNARVMGSIARRYVDDPFIHLEKAKMGFINERAHDIEKTLSQTINSHPLPTIMDGINLILKASFIAYSLGMLIGPGDDVYEID